MYQALVKNEVTLCLLRSEYEYPIGVFKHHDALYYPSEEAVFIVTKDAYPDTSEVSIWWPEQVRLLGTLTLSIPEGGGRVTFEPWNRGEAIPELPTSSDLSSDNIISVCLDFAMRLRASIEDTHSNPYILRKKCRSDSDVEYKLFENIDLEWALLMRGLYTLLKSQLLISSKPGLFMEEAFMNLQISLEAALQIICDHLSSTGTQKANKQDAYNYIRLNFELGDPLIKVLERQKESWIQTKHPRNPFVEDYVPWLWADDVYEPYEFLISIYRHIVLDEPGRSSMLL